MASSSGRYRKFKPLSLAEIEKLPALIGTPQVCGIAGIALPTAQNLMKSGEIKTARKIGHSWRCAKSEILGYFGLEV